MSVTAPEAAWFHQTFTAIVESIEKAFLGRTEVVAAAVTCLFAQGHLLLEDNAGSGKTTLARSLSRCVSGSQARIQFTADLTPEDIIGTMVWDERHRQFRLQTGPLFNSMILADELNRALPRTQSALLEVMEERQVTVRGVSSPIGPPFMVIATQNAMDSIGTNALPEATLDRFMMRLQIGQPSSADAARLLSESAIRDRSAVVTTMVNSQSLKAAFDIVDRVEIAQPLIDWMVALMEETRVRDGVRTGVSIRGGMSLTRAVRAWALAHGRPAAIAQDLIDLSHAVFDHRVIIEDAALREGRTGNQVMMEALAHVGEPPDVGVPEPTVLPRVAPPDLESVAYEPTQ
ncbi:MAG: AAA family ATPase [Microthrixaceae bacterium]